MSLQRKVKQISRTEIKPIVNVRIDQINTSVSKTNNTVGQVQSFDQTAGLYTISFPDGSTQTVAPGGSRPIGVGDGVIVSNGVIIA